jgi:hypothetical protein
MVTSTCPTSRFVRPNVNGANEPTSPLATAPSRLSTLDRWQEQSHPRAEHALVAMRAAVCLFAAAAPLPSPSTSTPCSHSRRSPAALLRCSPPRRGRLRGDAARALDERLLEAAPAEAPVSVVADAVDVMVSEEERPPAKAFVKSRRQRMQEEEDAAEESDRFKLINGKEVASCYQQIDPVKWLHGNLIGLSPLSAN